MTEKVMRHKELCDGLNTLYARKNHDYGDRLCEYVRSTDVLRQRELDLLERMESPYPNVLYTHTADMVAARIKGV